MVGAVASGARGLVGDEDNEAARDGREEWIGTWMAGAPWGDGRLAAFEVERKDEPGPTASAMKSVERAEAVDSRCGDGGGGGATLASAAKSRGEGAAAV